jgi:RNA polymerase sigma factor (sigma-70 family)
MLMQKSKIEQLTRWYREYGPELLLFARQLSTDQGAEDVVQEAFVQLIRQPQLPENVRAWLYRVVRNTAGTMFRRLRHRSLKQRVARHPENTWFDPRPEDMMDAQYAQDLLGALPRQQREIVVMRIWGQMTLKEISDLVQKPVSSIHRLYEMALETLRTKWEATPCAKNLD